MTIPEYIDEIRLIPRIILILMLYASFHVMFWFQGLESPSTAQAGFATGAFAATVGLCKFYFETGRK